MHYEKTRDIERPDYESMSDADVWDWILENDVEIKKHFSREGLEGTFDEYHRDELIKMVEKIVNGTSVQDVRESGVEMFRHTFHNGDVLILFDDGMIVVHNNKLNDPDNFEHFHETGYSTNVRFDALTLQKLPTEERNKLWNEKMKVAAEAHKFYY